MALQEDMFRLIKEWKYSGKKRNVFLKDKGITKDKFSYWIGKYNKLHRKKLTQKNIVKSDFKKIILPVFSQDHESEKLIEFIIPSGVKIIIYK